MSNLSYEQKQAMTRAFADTYEQFKENPEIANLIDDVKSYTHQVRIFRSSRSGPHVGNLYILSATLDLSCAGTYRHPDTHNAVFVVSAVSCILTLQSLSAVCTVL